MWGRQLQCVGAGSVCTYFPSSISHVAQLERAFSAFGVAHVNGGMYFVFEISYSLPPLPAKCNFGGSCRLFVLVGQSASLLGGSAW